VCLVFMSTTFRSSKNCVQRLAVKTVDVFLLTFTTIRPVPVSGSTVTPVNIPCTGTAGLGCGSWVVMKFWLTGVTVPLTGLGGRGGDGGGGGGRMICTRAAVSGLESATAATATLCPVCWARKFVFHTWVPRANWKAVASVTT